MSKLIFGALWACAAVGVVTVRAVVARIATIVDFILRIGTPPPKSSEGFLSSAQGLATVTRPQKKTNAFLTLGSQHRRARRIMLDGNREHFAHGRREML